MTFGLRELHERCREDGDDLIERGSGTLRQAPGVEVPLDRFPYDDGALVFESILIDIVVVGVSEDRCADSVAVPFLM